MGYDLVLPVTRGCLTEVFFFIGDLERRRPATPITVRRAPDSDARSPGPSRKRA
jgi:hypothetical protein